MQVRKLSPEKSRNLSKVTQPAVSGGLTLESNFTIDLMIIVIMIIIIDIFWVLTMGQMMF